MGQFFLESAASICLLEYTKQGLLLECLNPQQVCNNLQARFMEVVIMVYVWYKKKAAGMHFFHVFYIVFLKPAAADNMSLCAFLLTFIPVTWYICYLEIRFMTSIIPKMMTD